MRISVLSRALWPCRPASPSHRLLTVWAAGLALSGACSLAGAAPEPADQPAPDPAGATEPPASPVDLETVRAAAERTRAERSARVRTATTRVRHGVTGQPVVTETVVDLASGVGRTVTPNGLEVLAAGDEFWFRLPPAEAALAGASWLHGTAAQAVELFGADDDLLRLAAAGVPDPAFRLDQLAQASAARPLGPGTVDDVPVRGFVVDVAGVAHPVEVWLDADGRVRRTVETVVFADLALPAPLAADLTGHRLHVEVEYLAFGAAVDTARPAPEDTIALADLVAATP